MLGVIEVERHGDLVHLGGSGGVCFTGIRGTHGWCSGAILADSGGLRF